MTKKVELLQVNLTYETTEVFFRGCYKDDTLLLMALKLLEKNKAAIENLEEPTSTMMDDDGINEGNRELSHYSKHKKLALDMIAFTEMLSYILNSNNKDNYILVTSYSNLEDGVPVGLFSQWLLNVSGFIKPEKKTLVHDTQSDMLKEEK